MFLRRVVFLGWVVSAATGLAATDYPVQPVPFTAVRVTGGLWQARQEVNRTVTVPFALRQCEETGRLRNFDLAAETLRRRAVGERHFQNQPATQNPFDDSDVYKVIEGAAFALSMRADSALEKHLDGWITRIAAAQEPDGYLYTFRTMHPDKPVHVWINPQRWLNDPDLSHELYDLGHLYEAGVAYYQATGKRTLLDVCLKSAELVWRDFGDGRLRIAPGHPVIEMGLAKLYCVTGDRRYLDLARSLIEARGPGGKLYSQQDRRAVDQVAATGHAVRANYLYSGMADVAALGGDARYAATIATIWENMAGRKLYLTGGVGADSHGEMYGADYDLPNEAYNETCAAIALMMWNHRMFLLTGEARYMDVLERTAFNGFLSGVSLSGDRFFYTNPLSYNGVARNNNGRAGRAPWFDCACCPTNVIRTLADFTGYFYAVRDAALYVNFYAQSEGTAIVAGTAVKLTQTTDYPWSGAVRLEVAPAKPATFTLRVRIPGWVQGRPVPTDLYRYDDATAAGWSVRVGGALVNGTPEQGYLAITREWRAADTVELNLPMPVRAVRSNSLVSALQGRVAFERGPMVYCVEAKDRKGPPSTWVAPSIGEISSEARPDLLGGVTMLTSREPKLEPAFTAIPYFAWNNRGLQPMAVWLKRPPLGSVK